MPVRGTNLDNMLIAYIYTNIIQFINEYLYLCLYLSFSVRRLRSPMAKARDPERPVV